MREKGKKQQETYRNIGVSRNAYSETSPNWEYTFVDRGHYGGHGQEEWCADDATCILFIMFSFLPAPLRKEKNV